MSPPVDVGLVPADKKRVKVYELRNSDWFDRGTGLCAVTVDDEGGDPRIIVESEETPETLLLDTMIAKQEGFQKQQDTLIVWTEPAIGIDMALSFQEADGCAAIWKFINSVQTSGAEDDFAADRRILLPNPSLGNLKDIEDIIRTLGNTQAGRESLVKFVVGSDYLPKLLPMLEEAEDMESLPDLHRLCNIMKSLILLNDTAIIEQAVLDDAVLGVVGALEYDPDFPSHKANHRAWLSDQSRYREVVHIADQGIRQKIHYTYRLQYLKDVVLARVLDDPTFSILNSLIFFNQVDIIQHLQSNLSFLKELFGVLNDTSADHKRKKDAVIFIQQCCAIAKNIQPPARQQLYDNFLNQGLLNVICYALRHSDVAVRVGATDVLVSMIDHDPQMIRATIYRQMNEKQSSLTDSLIDLLLIEVDLGVKAQIADAIKVLLDSSVLAPMDVIAKANGEFSRIRSHPDPQQELCLVNFYEISAKKLFGPLLDLKAQQTTNFSVQQVSLFIHLIEILCFFIRQHQHRSKYFVLAENLCQRIAVLLGSAEKHLKLTALKFFRNLVGLNDEFYNQQMTQDRLFEPILDIIYESMPRDNLLNSACLELFEFIRQENFKPLINHIVENYRDKIKAITYTDTFAKIIGRYEQQMGVTDMDQSGLATKMEEDTPMRNNMNSGRRYQGIRDLDAAEEEYFNVSDEDDEAIHTPSSRLSTTEPSAGPKPLVDYTSDEDDNAMPTPGIDDASSTANDTDNLALDSTTRPERIAEKRRREDDEDDELAKLSQHCKRRDSGSSTGSAPSTTSTGPNASPNTLRRKGTFTNGREMAAGPRKISISLAPSVKPDVEEMAVAVTLAESSEVGALTR